MFKDSTAEAGSIAYNHGDNYIKLSTNGTNGGNERLRIASDGKITQFGGDLIIDQSNNGYGGLRVVDSSAGNYSVSYILGRNSGASAHVFKYNGRTQNQSPWANNGTGVEMGRWSGYGIAFGGDTAAANSLDDYEEGEVTITTTAQNGNAITVDGSYNKLTYTKIGNVVNIFGYVYFASNSNADGFLQINSLPFTVKDAHGASAHARFVNTAYLTRNYAYLPDGAGYYNVQGYANESNTWLRYYDLNGSGRRIDTLSKFLGSGTVINVNFAYLTA